MSAASEKGPGAPLATFLIERARILTPEGELPSLDEHVASPPIRSAETGVLVEGGRIVAVRPDLEAPPGAGRFDAQGCWLLPGWIDVQVNDIEWLRGGARPPEEHAARAREVIRHQTSHGVTGFLLATLAAPFDELLGYLSGLALARREPESPIAEAFLGALVEGTFMNPEYHGAHNPDYVYPPSRERIDSLLETGAVRAINIAPETHAGAADCIRYATERGAVVGVGHAKPHAERVREAVAAGLRYVIHLGNGPTGSSWKRFHDGGLLEEALRNDALFVTLIGDGWHVHPQLLRDWIRRKGLRRSAAVSDAGFATGPPEGEFEVFGVRGRSAGGGSYLEVVDVEAPANPWSSDAARLFGSAADMRRVFETLLNVFETAGEGVTFRRHPRLDLPAALAAASHLCARGPAEIFRLDDRGRLATGMRADLVLVDVSGRPGERRVEVVRTWVGGVEVGPR